MTILKPHVHQQTQRKRVTLLGATGSIGDSTLNIISQHKANFEVVALTAHSNLDKLIALALEHTPQLVVIGDSHYYLALKNALAHTPIRVAAGHAGLQEAALLPTDTVVSAIVGIAGLKPTHTAIEQGYTVALANKEALVCAGEILMQSCLKSGSRLLPIDSEHNAVFQVLAMEHRACVEKITLTASGGPFLRRDLASLASVTPKEATAHPKWNMGLKISVDSATMMNKALELIEAHYLFAIPPESIDVLIHPESIVHSLVHYADGSVLAQLGMPDMRIPISYALAWPRRLPIASPRLDLAAIAALHFEAPDLSRFAALRLVREALDRGAAALVALNAANEVAVTRFLGGQIPFTAIIPTVERVVSATAGMAVKHLPDVMEIDQDARNRAMSA